MALDKRKTQNIIVFVVVGLAVVLGTVAVLVKNGIITPPRATSAADMITEMTVIYMPQTDQFGQEVTDENGEVVYYSITDYYTRPKIRSNHVYPTTTKKHTEPVTTTEKQYYIEYTAVEEETDENGEKVTDENGKAVTKTVIQTKKTDEQGNILENGTTAEPTTVTTSMQTTSIVYKTDPLRKKPIKNIRGEYIIDSIATEAPTTTTTTTKPVVHVVGETSTTKKPSTTKSSTTAKDTTTTKKPAETSSDLSVTNPSTENTEPTSEIPIPAVSVGPENGDTPNVQ
ncbi:MAG: hypothetical protein IJJ61_09380 [Clostridia bacterium]|nr:hypothetical protein [Clostridia bacterium]